MTPCRDRLAELLAGQVCGGESPPINRRPAAGACARFCRTTKTTRRRPKTSRPKTTTISDEEDLEVEDEEEEEFDEDDFDDEFDDDFEEDVDESSNRDHAATSPRRTRMTTMRN